MFLDDSSDSISQVESLVLERPEPPVLREIFQLKRRLIDFRRNASGMRDVMNAIIRREVVVHVGQIGIEIVTREAAGRPVLWLW